ncbi:ThiJ/PfpI family protein [Infundibulicybe gibba]|nr:ThiJ/PfpI family protein [Infundibulicybe gibba]
MSANAPVKYGVILFPGFQPLDVFGSLDILHMLSRKRKLDLSIIAETLAPVSTSIDKPAHNPFGSDFHQSVVPTHTFASAPPLDVLIIPGGVGTRYDEIIRPVVEYVAGVYPTLQYIFTVCTGSVIASHAGILDGRRATSNKAVWAVATSHRPQVNWVPHARWVVDDGVGDECAVSLEYERHKDPSWDPFAKIHGL